jgi:hypothetical protein
MLLRMGFQDMGYSKDVLMVLMTCNLSQVKPVNSVSRCSTKLTVRGGIYLKLHCCMNVFRALTSRCDEQS